MVFDDKMPAGEWSPENYSVAELRSSFQLPQIVKINCNERVESDADLDLYQPLLLYKAYKSVKVQARLLYRHRVERKDVFQTYGDMSLVIPKGYTGLFALLDENGRSTAKRFMMINDLMKASGRVSSSFLIHNCVVQGFRRISDRHYKRTILTSGTVLRAVGIFTDQTTFIRRGPGSMTSRATLKQSIIKLFTRRQKFYEYGNSCSSEETVVSTAEDFTQRSYLKCVNAFHEELYIPLTSAGTFYLISDPERPKDYNNDCIHLMSTLIAGYRFPCRVKLVCGYLPEMHEHFSGFLQLESIQTCDVILACTMQQPPYQLFEVDFNSEFELKVAPVAHALYLDSRFRSALAFAKVQSDSWRRQIKIAHQVTVDAEEEEHIYQEIPGSSCFEEPVSRLSPGGSTGSRSRSRSSKEDTEVEDPAVPSADTDTLLYRLSVLSHPTRISFA
ncbi:uncharacterized protein LOC129583271 [Paramacrobiotus metropolitanus]|uniref:uncharacterized protein LOC129583271 n=1 Tax=Paramacrobiotus metropolitanus TaxID=2943436 RepID=UPI002445D67E|nr:uncharacterized protein LOC129583271 [Paramacrobiotus metropolitanus]